MRPFELLHRLGLLGLLFALAACTGNEDGVTPGATNTPEMTLTPTPAANPDTAGAAFVDSLDVVLLAAQPPQVQVTVGGNLNDGCTEIAAIDAQQAGDRFQIQIETTRDPDLACTQALVPFTETVMLATDTLAPGTYEVMAGTLSETFTWPADNEQPAPTPDLSGATLSVDVATGMPGDTVGLIGTGYPAGATIEIGIGQPQSEYEIFTLAQADDAGRLDARVEIPDYVTPGEWVFVADVDNAKVIADPLMITAGATATPDPYPGDGGDGVNEPVDGEFTRTYIYLIALEDDGTSGPMIGCNDSAVPVVVTIEPTIAPLTAALETLLSIDDQYYGQSGLYNVFYQSNLQLEAVTIENRVATIQLTGELQLGGACDNPRVQAQLAFTAQQYDTVDSVTITLNGVDLEMVLSGQ